MQVYNLIKFKYIQVKVLVNLKYIQGIFKKVKECMQFFTKKRTQKRGKNVKKGKEEKIFWVKMYKI